MVKPIRVVVVDPQPVVADSLRALAEATTDIEIVGSAVDVESALRQVREYRPSLIVLDLVLLRGSSGLSLVRLIESESLPPRCIIFSAIDRDTYLDQALKLSVRGYLLKSAAVAELLEALRMVARGGHAFSAAISARLAFGPAGPTLREVCWPRTACLNPREHEVLVHLARGLMVKEIAAEMRLSRKTVDNYKSRAMKQLGVHRSADLMRVCYEEGLIPAAPGLAGR